MDDSEVYLLDRCDNLDYSRFEKEYLKEKKPVIISKSFDGEVWKKWNLDYLKEKYQDKIVVLTVFNPNVNMPGAEVKLKLPEAIDLINNNPNKNKKHYLMQRSLHEDFPELILDIAMPKYANNYEYINFWLGENGIITKAHYDYYDNFLTQIFGRKRVRLFAPTDTPYMHGYSRKDTMTVEGVQYPAVHSSQIADIDLVDTNKFPNIRFATPFEGVLNPGDLLYIPAGWWHEVKSLDVTMSINFWWKIKIEDFPADQLTNLVCSYFSWFGESFHERMRLAFDLTEFDDDLQIAEFCLSKNLKCVSALFLLSYLNRKLSSNNVLLKAYKILEWEEYLETAKSCSEELLDNKKILDIISETKSLQF